MRSSGAWRVEVVGVSKQGRRSYQEDRWAAHVTTHGALLCVCDGVGGTALGDVAAESGTRGYLRVAEEGLAAPGVDARHVVRVGHDEAWANVQGLNGATTCTALVLVPSGQSWVSHLGDTRLYRWREGSGLSVLTVEHRLGRGRRHVLARTLNGRCGSDPDILAVGEARPGDVYLVASDGCWEEWRRADIAECLQKTPRVGPHQVAEELVRWALLNSMDNCTAVVGVVHGERVGDGR